MSVESKVFDQLNKVELKSQKIELSIVDTIKKESEKASDTFYAAVVLINNARNKAEDLLKTAMLFANGNSARISEAEKMFNELGIEVPKEVLDAKTSTKNLLKKSQDGIGMLKKIDL